jgi:hypothetical protein
MQYLLLFLCINSSLFGMGRMNSLTPKEQALIAYVKEIKTPGTDKRSKASTILDLHV